MSEPTRCDVGPTVTISRSVFWFKLYVSYAQESSSVTLILTFFYFFFRNGKQIKPLDQRLRNHFQDSGTTFRNPITIDSPSPPIIPNSSLDFPRFMHVMQFILNVFISLVDFQLHSHPPFLFSMNRRTGLIVKACHKEAL